MRTSFHQACQAAAADTWVQSNLGKILALSPSDKAPRTGVQGMRSASPSGFPGVPSNSTPQSKVRIPTVREGGATEEWALPKKGGSGACDVPPHVTSAPRLWFPSVAGLETQHLHCPPLLLHFPFPHIPTALESHPPQVGKLCPSLWVQHQRHHFLLKYLGKVKKPL